MECGDSPDRLCELEPDALLRIYLYYLHSHQATQRLEIVTRPACTRHCQLLLCQLLPRSCEKLSAFESRWRAKGEGKRDIIDEKQQARARARGNKEGERGDK
jgi:hypothetical protein